MSRSPREGALRAALLAFAAVSAAYQLGRAYFHPKQGLDLAPAWVAARIVLSGKAGAIYDHAAVVAAGEGLPLPGMDGVGAPILNFIYPPWAVLPYLPLARLPWGAARALWFVLSLAATAWGVVLTARATAAGRPAEERRELSLLALAAAGVFFPIVYGQMGGQSNGLLFLAVAGSLLASARGRGFLAGFLCGLAAACKPFLAAPALLFARRRDGAALAGLAAAGAAAFVLSLPVGGLGGFRRWADAIAAHNAFGEAEARNHGVAGAAAALFRPTRGYAAPIPAPDAAAPATWALGAGVAALALLALRTVPERGSPHHALAFGATLAAALLLTPKSWEHYGVFLFPCFLAAWVVAKDGADRGEPRAVRRAGAVALLFSLWALTFQVGEEYEALLAHGLVALWTVKFWASAALLALAALLLRALPRR